jgi:CubicO group peptidase (beta-lactamase class C family)
MSRRPAGTSSHGAASVRVAAASISKRTAPVVARVVVAVALAAAPRPSAAQVATPAAPASGATVPPAMFADPLLRTRLAGAFPQIDRLVGDAAARQKFPGAVLGVVIDGELAHVASAGVQDLETRRPVTADSVFRIASMTKSFTAVAILTLRDEGKLSLDDPVERYVPELAALPYPTGDSPKITIRHLLSHSEGFPEDNPWGDRQLARTDAWLDAAMRAGIPFSTVPGTAYEYSNYGFGILGRVVRNVAKEPYERYVERTVLVPLGMTSTTFEVAEVDKARLAPGYRLVDGRFEPEDLLPHGAFGAMGGLWTSVRDLAKYVAFLMSAFPPRDGPDAGPLRRASAREMHTVARYTPTMVRRPALDGPLQLSAGGYGFGLRVSEDCTLGLNVGHGGGLPGYGSLMRWYPERGVGLVSMANLTYAGWGPVFNDAFNALRGTGGLTARSVVPSPALLEAKRAVSELVVRWDTPAAERLAADNLFLDESAERRRASLARLLERHGSCRPDEAIDAENALRGTWRMTCGRGWLDVAITLAPTMPPRLQQWNVRGVMPPGRALQKAIDEVLSLMTSWDRERAKRLLDPTVDPDQVSRQLQIAGLQAGACTQGDTLVGDGTRALFTLKCERAELMADVVLDVVSERATLVRVMSGRSQTCAP